MLGALNEAEDALSAYGQDQTRRALFERAAAEDRAALALARRRFEAGAVSYRDVLQAEARLEDAELALTGATAASAEDLVGLYKALGGGWQTGKADAG